MMDRRAFLAGTGGVLLVAPLAAEGQQGGKVCKVGELHPGSGSEERLAALREVGYVEGRTWSSNAACRGRLDRLPALATGGRPETGRHSRDG
jgi:hypothetical protein